MSAVSSWEISIKKSLGKLEAPADLGAIIEDEGFSPLAITLFHGERAGSLAQLHRCLLYTSDAADERSSVDLGGRRIIKKKNKGRDTAR